MSTCEEQLPTSHSTPTPLSDPAAGNAMATVALAAGSTARPKLGWKGALEGLAKSGALGTTKRWSAVVGEIKKTTAELDQYDVQLRKHSYSATIGKAKREVAKPAPCPVHSYNTSLSTLRSNIATFGKASLDKPPPTAGPAVHSYSSLGTSFTPKLGATFGRAHTGRGEPPKTACSVHSYSGVPPPTPLGTRKPTTRGGTFGTAPARPGTIAMTRTGLLLSSKPAMLPPLTPLQTPSRTVVASHAQGFASKLKRAVASAEEVTATPSGARLPETKSRINSAEVLVIDPTGGEHLHHEVTIEQLSKAAEPRLSDEKQRELGRLGNGFTVTPPVLPDTDGDTTPTEHALGDAEDVRTTGAAALVLELAKEGTSPVKRKLAMVLPARGPLALDEAA